MFLICKTHQDFSSSSGACDPLCSVDETSSQELEATYQPKTDFLKALAVFAAAGTGALAINHSWVAANQVLPYVVWFFFHLSLVIPMDNPDWFENYMIQDVAMALLFGIGYAGIVFEESLAFNKSGVGLLMAVSLWVIRSIGVSIINL